ncbi:MAG: flavin-dependent oxidoreductase, partial [Shimia sp.]|uniref:flavin-dependent oxidoreductase n=1 Tax=Shimia sp. TaxID=1954381 RepID=UPI0040583B2A
MATGTVIIAGGGIAGLALGLTLHQIGVPCVVCESAQTMKPLGVGINLQPNAVRELIDLGFTEQDLDAIGLPIREWALVGQKGQEIYAEPRGKHAGYNWPQYAVQRGTFHMALYERFHRLAGPNAIRLGHRLSRYDNNADGTVTAIFDTASGPSKLTGAVLIGADGIHSAVRAQMHPDQPPIHWGGALLWRGTTWAKPLRSGASFIGLGTHAQRMVIYPISAPDPDTGLVLTNWIAEVTHDNPADIEVPSWFRQVTPADFIHHFTDWTYDWLDVPALINGADAVFENPMIDRDPIPTWIDGPVALMGDAAHAMYPTGSNGASQAIIDARTLGAKILEHGVGHDALAAYNAALHGPISELILRNRQDGPFGLLTV